MRKCRVNLPNQCYHLVSRVFHRAFFLDEEERTRFVDLIRRVTRFSGAKLLADGIMSNHSRIFIYIGRLEQRGTCSAAGRIARSELTNAVAAVDADYRYGYQFDSIGNRISANERGTNSVYAAA